MNFVETHDRAVWQCLANILRTDLSECPGAVQDAATVPYIGWARSQEGHACQWSCSLGQLGRSMLGTLLSPTLLLHHFEGAAITPC